MTAESTTVTGRMPALAAFLLFSLVNGLLSGCARNHNRDTGAATPRLTSIAVSLGKATIAVGESEQVSAVAKDQNGAVMSGVAFAWSSSNTTVATVTDGVTTGVASGTTDLSASSAGVSSAGVMLTVTAATPHVASISVSPASASIATGQTQVFTAQAKDQNGVDLQGVAFTWNSSSAAVASIADGTATGVAPGTAEITASSAGVTSNMAALTVTDAPSGAGGSTTASSEELIDQDLKAGAISEEQAFIYRVYSAFGSPDLPSKYASALVGMIDLPIPKEMAKRYSTLSPAAKAALLPYFSPPIYQGSWGDLGVTSAPSARAKATSTGVRPQEVFASGCGDNVLPSMNADWLFKTTAHFKIWYRTSAPPAHYNPDPFTPEQAEAAAAKIEAVAEKVYDKLTAHFGKVPISDVDEVCNGGDGLIDIYMTRMNNNALAMTSAFVPGCAERPTWMWISPDRVLLGNDAQDVFAHEFMHMIDFAYSRGDCEESAWLGEAAGNWAIDFVYHGDQYEQKGPTSPYAPYGTYAPCYYDQDFAAPIEQSVFPQSGCNGYSDYVFLFFLSNKYGPETIRRIFDFAQLYNSLDAIDAALSSAGGLKAVWPDFVTAGWNDWEAGVAGDFYKWDSLKEGRKVWLVRDPNASGAETLSVDLKGLKEKTFALDVFFGSSNSIEPLGARYLYIKFTDDAARIVTFNNKPTQLSGDISHLAVQALMKINGQWQPPEDWTNVPSKTFCRDAKAGRIEELVVMYSNSSPVRPRESSVLFLNDNQKVLPTLDVSNVGCWRWEGTASLTTHTVDGPVTIESATVVYDADPTALPGLTDGGLSLGYDIFTTSAGSSASYSISGTDAAIGCTITGSASAPMLIEPNGPVTHHDGDLIVNFGLPDPLHRAVLGTGRTLIAGVVETLACRDSTELVTLDKTVTWLSLPQPPSETAVTISDDGQSFIGTWTRSDDEGDKVSVWNLHAVREQ